MLLHKMEAEMRKIRENQEKHNKEDSDYQKLTDVRMEKQDGVLNRIEDGVGHLHEKIDILDTKVSYTNGKVASLTSWKYYISGAFAVILALLTIISPFVISQYINSRENSISKDDVRKIVSEVLDDKATITK